MINSSPSGTTKPNKLIVNELGFTFKQAGTNSGHDFCEFVPMFDRSPWLAK